MIILRVIIVFFLSLSTAEWTTRENEIYFQDKAYGVRGVNWFGAETDCMVPHGLWVHSLDYYLDRTRSYGFNSLRIPFSYENVRNMDVVVKEECVLRSPSLQGKTFRQALHLLIGGAKYRNMTVLLDFHTAGGIITEFPYTPVVSEQDFLNTWEIVLYEYGAYPNLIGVDIKNEPHGNIRWPEWGGFAGRVIDTIHQRAPWFQGLFFVEGIQEPADHSVWGGSFSRMDDFMGRVPDARIVFSPHVYGVSVRGNIALYDDDSNWMGWFAFLHGRYTNPICIGEVGGWFEGDDEAWHRRVLDFLRRVGVRNHFYWCLNPNSIDTGGLFDFDWTTINDDKVEFCRQLQPSPSFPAFRTLP